MDSIINISGEQIAKFRNSNTPPITQEELAAKLQSSGLDIDRGAIAKIETKKRKVYDYELVIFAKVLKVSISALLGGE